jgi:hypothetical protein
MQQNSPQNIVAQFPKTIWNCHATNLPALKKIVENWTETHTCYAFGESLHVTLHNEENAEKKIANLLLQHVPTATASIIEPGIEDCFMALMNNYA